jgi:hypothetical protein
MIFFHTSAMVPADKRIVLNIELPISCVAESSQDHRMIHGFIDYATVATEKAMAGRISVQPA